MILQLNPTIWLKTPKGIGLAHFLIDYGEEHDLMWVVADDATGEVWTWSNPEVRFIPNTSLGAIRKSSDNSPSSSCKPTDDEMRMAAMMGLDPVRYGTWPIETIHSLLWKEKHWDVAKFQRELRRMLSQ